MSEPAPHHAELLSSLERYFGFTSFRDRQEEVVRRAVEGRDTLAIMPTGAGKSICYQLAAMLRPTPTLVISPLIALMKDQVDNLPESVRDQAIVLNSSLDQSEVARRLHDVKLGKYRIIYAAPERLRQERFVSALKSAGVGLVVIDEVHCVSMWGHDFRPDYLFIASALKALGSPSVLGMTATATPTTAADIGNSLGRRMEVVRSTVVRSNLRYTVIDADNEEEKRRKTVSIAQSHRGSGIVYARSREKCERLAELLRRNKVQATHYHAGLLPAERVRVQDQFLRGQTRVIVATTAFGMGIDKADIRWVLLYDFPGSLEDYVQRVGRAGRDGLLSECILLASDNDASNLRRFARSSIPTVDQLRAVYRQVRSVLRSGTGELAVSDLTAGLNEDQEPRVLLGMLERVGLIQRDFDSGRAMNVKLLEAPPDSGKRIEALLHEYESQARERANRLIRFASSEKCRHRQVAEHFGEHLESDCDRCDVCNPQAGNSAKRTPMRPLPASISQAIIDAIDSLQWPLGQRGLTAMLFGSVGAPPSARASKSFGLLASAREGSIRRWIEILIKGGNLEYFENDGYRLLRVADRQDLPTIISAANPDRAPSTSGSHPPVDDGDRELFDRLRSWRQGKARDLNWQPYMILSDRTLGQIASARPRTERDLRGIEGIGDTKLALYGADLLALVQPAQ
ncbi:MAG: RecQ family ATP-dependent DNA helicase [Chloroflexota bacterium]